MSPLVREITIEEIYASDLLKSSMVTSSFCITEAFVYIEGHTGGLLCLDHVSLPGFVTKFSKGDWTLEMHCCCQGQQKQVEDRISEIM